MIRPAAPVTRINTRRDSDDLGLALEDNLDDLSIEMFAGSEDHNAPPICPSMGSVLTPAQPVGINVASPMGPLMDSLSEPMDEEDDGDVGCTLESWDSDNEGVFIGI